MTEYVELHARSAFSFLEGATLPEHLMQQAAHLGMPGMALLDRNGLYGAMRFYTEGVKRGVRAHIGAEVAVSDFGPRLRPAAYLPHQFPVEPARIPLLVESKKGYQNLCRLITQYKLGETTKAEGAALLTDIEQYRDGLVCLTGGTEGPLAAALAQGGYDAAHETVEHLVGVFGANNVFVEVQRHFNRDEEQPLYHYNFPHGYYLRSTALWVYNSGSNVDDIPIGLGVGKVWKKFSDGKTINVFAEPQYSIWRSGVGAPGWQLFTGVNFQFSASYKLWSK